MSHPETHAEAPTEARTQTRPPLPTIWEVSDELWDNLFRPLLAELDPPARTGRPRADPRRCLEGMIYRARTGCQWNKLPERFGSDSTVHRTVYRWDARGVFDRLWAVLIYHCEELSAVHWEWQAADGCLNKARFIGKKGAKADRARHRKTARPKTAQEQRGLGVKASALILPTVPSWASSRACWSRAEAARWLCASPGRT